MIIHSCVLFQSLMGNKTTKSTNLAKNQMMLKVLENYLKPHNLIHIIIEYCPPVFRKIIEIPITDTKYSRPDIIIPLHNNLFLRCKSDAYNESLGFIRILVPSTGKCTKNWPITCTRLSDGYQISENLILLYSRPQQYVWV